jgi:hypothetical protein
MLQAQIVKDERGKPMGVFIPISDWELIKQRYPDIDNLDTDIPQWEKDFIDERLKVVNDHPEHLHPVKDLFRKL